MEINILNILLSVYGTTLILIIGILVKLLWRISDKQSEHEIKMNNNNILVTKIDNQDIPTIRIQIEKLDERTDNLEHNQQLTDQRVRWLEKETK